MKNIRYKEKIRKLGTEGSRDTCANSNLTERLSRENLGQTGELLLICSMNEKRNHHCRRHRHHNQDHQRHFHYQQKL